MMKNLGLLLMLGLMYWSWIGFYSTDKGIAEQTMMEIQDTLQDQIFTVMRKNSPGITNIIFEKFWTKEINKQSVIAHFLMSFDEGIDDGVTKVTREGNVTLVKADETEDEQVWIVDAIKIQGENITFEKGMKLVSSAKEAEAEIKKLEEAKDSPSEGH